MLLRKVDDHEVSARRLVATLPMPTSFRAAVMSCDVDGGLEIESALPGTERFSVARMRKFRLGRTCAARAMNALGKNVGVLPIGSDRAPVWPGGVVGSITHSADISVAVVAASDQVAAIGIDLETSKVLKPSLAERISTPGELDGIDVEGADEGLLLFSMKEAIFKCVSRFVERFVDFTDVSVSVDTDRMTFGIRSSTLPALHSIRGEIFGLYRVDSGSVITLAFREATARQSALPSKPGQ